MKRITTKTGIKLIKEDFDRMDHFPAGQFSDNMGCPIAKALERYGHTLYYGGVGTQDADTETHCFLINGGKPQLRKAWNDLKNGAPFARIGVRKVITGKELRQRRTA